jgi:type IV fimbrial biogenesis protein FimT
MEIRIEESAERGLGKRRRGLSATVERGFTLIELLVVIAIVAIVTGFAVPGFGNLRRAAGVSVTASELLGSLHFARSAAVLNGEPVTLCLSANQETCVASGSEAATGWLVFPDPGAKVSGAAAAGQPILRSFRSPNDIVVQGSRAAVTFWPVTRASTTSTFEVCDVNPEVSRTVRGRAVVVSQTGRPRVAAEEAACGR